MALLDDPSNSHFIAWTGRGMEFKLIEPEEVRRSAFTHSSHTPVIRRLKTTHVSCEEGITQEVKKNKTPGFKWTDISYQRTVVLHIPTFESFW